jgi:hypothetical protein
VEAKRGARLQLNFRNDYLLQGGEKAVGTATGGIQAAIKMAEILWLNPVGNR